MLRLIHQKTKGNQIKNTISKHLMLRLIWDGIKVVRDDKQFQNILCYG